MLIGLIHAGRSSAGRGTRGRGKGGDEEEIHEPLSSVIGRRQHTQDAVLFRFCVSHYSKSHAGATSRLEVK